MAKKVKTITEEEQVIETPAQPVEPVEVTEEPVQVDEDLDSFLSSFAEEEPQIKIYKYNNYGKSVYMNEVSHDMATESYIQSKWGEGKYRVMLYREGKYLASKNLWIGPPAEKPEPEPNPVQPVPGGSDIMMQMILSELNANRELMRAMIERVGNGSSKSSLIELAEAMNMLKGVVTPPQPQSPAGMITEMVGILKQGIEIGKAGGDSGGGWMGLVKDVAAAIPEVIKTLPGRTPPANAPGPGGAPSPVPVEVPAPIKLAMAYLKTKAAKGSDPNVYIEVALDNLDDPRWASLIELADHPYEEIAGALEDPELLNAVYRPWFEELLKGIRDAIHNRESAAGGSGDNGADPPQNEGFSA